MKNTEKQNVFVKMFFTNKKIIITSAVLKVCDIWIDMSFWNINSPYWASNV